MENKRLFCDGYKYKWIEIFYRIEKCLGARS